MQETKKAPLIWELMNSYFIFLLEGVAAKMPILPPIVPRRRGLSLRGFSRVNYIKIGENPFKIMKMDNLLNGFIFELSSRNYSENTIKLYKYQLEFLCNHLNNPDVASIDRNDLIKFFYYLRTTYKVEATGKPISKRYLKSFWVTYSAFWKWLNKEFQIENIILTIEAPKVNQVTTEPFNQSEIKALLAAVKYSPALTPRQQQNALNRTAMILTLLDTGIRKSELMNLKIYHADLDKQTLRIEHGKGDKLRIVPFGAKTRAAIWKSLVNRSEDQNEPLFPNSHGGQWEHSTLRDFLKWLGKKAKIKNVHPHRFRHTFAIQFIRNGGNAFTLSYIMGHESMETTKRYIKLAQLDIKEAHEIGSPVDNWL